MSNKYSNFVRPKEKIKIEERLLPLGFANRTGIKQKPEYIVIHEVSLGLGKSPEIYNMEKYAKKIYEDGKKGSDIGYHFLVGDKEIYQFLKEDESTCHTGTTEGNKRSIGIERLICKGINYEFALHNQAKLIATLMIKWNIPFNKVKTHKGMQWIYTPERENKKNCPSRMLAGQRGGEEKFRREIIKCFKHRWFFYELLTPEMNKQLQIISDKEINDNYYVDTKFPYKR